MQEPITDTSILRLFLDSLFQSLEDITARNRAYREALQKEPNAEYLRNQVDRAEKALLAQREPEKYRDIRLQAIQSVQDHSLDELAALSQIVRE